MEPAACLVCGDVGFGKTEIAIRAAFKAVQENKQVVYLTRQEHWSGLPFPSPMHESEK